MLRWRRRRWTWSYGGGASGGGIGGGGWGGGRVVCGGGSGDCERGIERVALPNSVEFDFPSIF